MFFSKYLFSNQSTLNVKVTVQKELTRHVFNPHPRELLLPGSFRSPAG